MRFLLFIMATTLLAAGPKFNAKQELQLPADYRSWVYLTSGLGMSYGPAARESATPPFDNVLVEPKAHAAFLKTGRWPEGTMFALELRRSLTGQSINRTGRSQGDVIAVEMAIKDSKRFKDGWGYIQFNKGITSSAPMPETADCYSCHKQNAAVDNTFVQFYPTLIDVARAKGVLKIAYLEAEKQASGK
jgi:Cytochrome P460